eukprot:scaffold6750_cov160-Amphora_coffeaeformis.AAC.2
MDPNYQLQLETMLLLARASQLPPATQRAPQLERRIALQPQQIFPFSESVMPPLPNQPLMTDRQRFYMFTKVLFKYLKKANVDVRYAKLVVAKCIRQSQNGVPISLVDTLERELRQCIGEIHWLRANQCFQAYCRKLGQRRTHSVSVQAV